TDLTVLRQYRRVQAPQHLVPGDRNRAPVKLAAYAEMVKPVMNQDSAFGFVPPVQLADAPNGNHLGCATLVLVLADQYRLAVVIGKTNSPQALVRSTLA